MPDYDVVILGGAFCGAASGVLLKRGLPELKVLIIEKSEQFDRKVGESTSEVAGCFLSRVLGLQEYLTREHITKHGLRMWFNGDENECASRCSEIGPYYQVRLPTFQVDRIKLDSHILETATDLGCELLRPANVRNLELGGLGHNSITVRQNDQDRVITAKWVLDATGKAAYIARKFGHLRKLDGHPTSAVWARYQNVTDLDNIDLLTRFPDFAHAVRGPRGQATNHLMGYGWWCWIIPLKNGEVSAGLTYDSRLFSLPAGGSLAERLHKHLVTHPIGKELFGEAIPVARDSNTYSNLPYYSAQPAGDGWFSLGDAAGFIDPLYSQGLDYCSHAVSFATKIITTEAKGECIKGQVDDYAQQFVTSYFRWYHALYEEKYRYMGDAELMNIAFLLDIGTYFIGPVRLVHDHPEEEFPRFPYYGVGGKIFANFMRFYNRRLARIAERRRAAGTYGARNLDQRYLIKEGFSPCKKAATKIIIKGTLKWIGVEIRSVFLPRPAKSTEGTPASDPQTSS